MAKKKTRTGGGRADKLRRRTARASKTRAQDTGRQLPSWPGRHACPGAEGREFEFCGACEGCADFIDFVEAVLELEFCGACEGCAPRGQRLDTSRCPVAGTCAGCGQTAGLRAVTAAFLAPVPSDVPFIEVACATLCGACAESGESFVRRLGPAGLDHALARHWEHGARSSVPGPRPADGNR